jgi:hypothetical protein
MEKQKKEQCCSKRGCMKPAQLEVYVSCIAPDLSEIVQFPHPVIPYLCLDHAKMIDDHPLHKPTILYKPIKQKEEALS